MDSEIAPALQRLTAALRQAQDVSVQIGSLMRQAEEEAAEPFRGQSILKNSFESLLSNQLHTSEDDSYSSQESALAAWSLVFGWFFEHGPEVRFFGPEHSLTQDVRYDPGMEQFRREWAKTGYRLPSAFSPTSDVREGGLLSIRIMNGVIVYVREHLLQLPLSTIGLGSSNPDGPIDAVGGIIGSLDRVVVTKAGNNMVKFEVYNVMGWQSGSRIPGTDTSVFQNQPRSAPGPGGTTIQYFYWWESTFDFEDLPVNRK